MSGVRGLFVTGTDTGIGKTRVALSLMLWLQRRGLRVLGMKPVASGCRRMGGVLRNDDALQLQQAGSVPVPYEWVNPYAYELPVAPSIAAELSGQCVDLDVIAASCRQLARECDVVVVEGVGGWEAPLDNTLNVSDLAAAIGFPVVLVVGLRLGCINHALLTERAIVRSAASYRGWCANACCSDFPFADANLRTLEARLSGRRLGAIPFRSAPDVTATADDFDAMLVL